MAGKRTRRRRGHPHGKAYGFNGVRPASSTQKTKSDSGTQQDSGTSSTPTSTSSTGS